MSDKGDKIPIQLKHNGREILVDCLSSDHSICDLKEELYRRTSVLPENQKILGLRTRNNDPVTNSTKLSCLLLKANTRLMLIGSTQEEIFQVNSAKDCPDVVDDFDYKEEDIDLCHAPENIEKVEKRCKAYRPRKLAEFRDGKKLLVLDIDYTIFDHLTPAESAHHLARPYLTEFLTRAYVHYDIAIWSATSMTWILAKLGQLGIIPMSVARTFQHRNHQVGGSDSTVSNLLPSENLNSADNHSGRSFQIALILDSSDMISVEFTEHGIKEVKPLAVIWKNHPHWGPHNTIMFDDVRRNFIMNPQSGLRIRSYRDAHTNCSHDRELLHLIEYLELIALKENDFNKLNHNSWERYLHKHRKQLKTLKSQQKRWKNRQDNRTITNSNDHPSDVQSSSSTTVCAPVLAAAVVAADSSPSLCSPSVNEPNRISSSITIDISSSDSLISGQKRVHSDDDDGDDGSTGDNDEVIKISNEIEGVESSKPVHKTNNS